jgi:aspartyl-tRNA(Asn)/glutamyl-tRNA(Gln) amidotransferase subunit C
VTLPESEVERIAHLARIAILPERHADLARDLSRILELFEVLAGVDTDSVEPLAHPMELTQRMRPDVVTERDESGALLAIAPAVADGLFVVPKVID